MSADVPPAYREIEQSELRVRYGSCVRVPDGFEPLFPSQYGGYQGSFSIRYVVRLARHSE